MPNLVTRKYRHKVSLRSGVELLFVTNLDKQSAQKVIDDISDTRQEELEHWTAINTNPRLIFDSEEENQEPED